MLLLLIKNKLRVSKMKNFLNSIQKTLFSALLGTGALLSWGFLPNPPDNKLRNKNMTHALSGKIRFLPVRLNPVAIVNPIATNPYHSPNINFVQSLIITCDFSLIHSYCFIRTQHVAATSETLRLFAIPSLFAAEMLRSNCLAIGLI